METQVHYNWMALRDRYLLTKAKTPIWTDEKYCEAEGLDPSVYAYNKEKMQEYFVSKQENTDKAIKEYEMFLINNGLLDSKEG